MTHCSCHLLLTEYVWLTSSLSYSTPLPCCYHQVTNSQYYPHPDSLTNIVQPFRSCLRNRHLLLSRKHYSAPFTLLRPWICSTQAQDFPGWCDKTSWVLFFLSSPLNFSDVPFVNLWSSSMHDIQSYRFRNKIQWIKLTFVLRNLRDDVAYANQYLYIACQFCNPLSDTYPTVWWF